MAGQSRTVILFVPSRGASCQRKSLSSSELMSSLWMPGLETCSASLFCTIARNAPLNFTVLCCAMLMKVCGWLTAPHKSNYRIQSPRALKYICKWKGDGGGGGCNRWEKSWQIQFCPEARRIIVVKWLCLNRDLTEESWYGRRGEAGRYWGGGFWW